jgi:GNAT superfamily N-acetyltransferase
MRLARNPWMGQSSVMADEIVIAATDADYEIFGDLVREYWAWLQQRYTHLPGFIDSIGGLQALDTELQMLRETYGPPAGKALLALRGSEVTGVVAYRDLHDGSCEMKRLFVPERFQGHGTGRLLCHAVLDAATGDGYRLMRLDTGYQNSEAITMYKSLGFHECGPHHQYPAELLPHLRFLEKTLVAESSED